MWLAYTATLTHNTGRISGDSNSQEGLLLIGGSEKYLFCSNGAPGKPDTHQIPPSGYFRVLDSLEDAVDFYFKNLKILKIEISLLQNKNSGDLNRQLQEHLNLLPPVFRLHILPITSIISIHKFEDG
jgi:hypothetical protein